jgi:hypothetical protein
MDRYGRVVAMNAACARLNPGIDGLSPEELVDLS